jgi:hypothetical protein
MRRLVGLQRWMWPHLPGRSAAIATRFPSAEIDATPGSRSSRWDGFSSRGWLKGNPPLAPAGANPIAVTPTATTSIVGRRPNTNLASISVCRRNPPPAKVLLLRRKVKVQTWGPGTGSVADRSRTSLKARPDANAFRKTANMRVAELVLRGAGGEPVDFARTIVSHGVAELPPNKVDLAGRALVTTLPVRGGARTVRLARGVVRYPKIRSQAKEI